VRLLSQTFQDRRSFERIAEWMRSIKQYANTEIVVMIAGNKCDMAQQRVVSTADGEALASDYGVPFIETSARDNTNIEEAFLKLAQIISEKHGGLPEPTKRQDTITIDPNNNTKSSGGCSC